MTSKDPRRWWALTAMSLAVFLVAVDGTVLSLATPSIVKDLQPTASQVLWIGDIYSFVLAGLLITMGNVGDRVGRKRLLLIGGTAFALISIPAAYSNTAEQLIFFRALMGVAGATLMPSTLALMRSTFSDPAERSFAIGVWSAMGAAGAAAGTPFRRHPAAEFLVGFGVPGECADHGAGLRDRHAVACGSPATRIPARSTCCRSDCPWSASSAWSMPSRSWPSRAWPRSTSWWV
ncbi:MAG: MFS transporter [Candidatus Nanopelagicales bacterium]